MRRLVLIGFSLWLVGCSGGFKASSEGSPVGLSFPNPSPAPSPSPGPQPQSSPSPAPVVTPSPNSIPSPTPSPSPATPAACGTATNGQLYISGFNVDATGSRDSATGIQAAIDCAKTIGTNTIVIPAGNFLISKDLHLYSGQMLLGNGPTVSKITAYPGVIVPNLVDVNNVSSVTIKNIGFYGNGLVQMPAISVGRAITVSVDTSGSIDMDQITITGNSFENFSTDCWVCFQSYSQTLGMTNITVTGNTFTSHDGNASNPSNIGSASTTVWFGGSHTLPLPTNAHPYGGLVYNTVVQGNTFNIPHVKQAVTVWASVDTVSIANNVMNAVGVSGDIPDNVGAYAVLVYDNAYSMAADGTVTLTGGLSPANVYITGNQMLSVHSCGVYVASAANVYIENNTINGQYDTQNQTIPKAAISLNGPKIAVVTGNTITNSYIGLSLDGLPSGGSIISTESNSIQVRAGGYGIWIQNYAGDVVQVSQTSIDVSAGATAYNMPFSSGTVQYNP